MDPPAARTRRREKGRPFAFPRPASPTVISLDGESLGHRSDGGRARENNLFGPRRLIVELTCRQFALTLLDDPTYTARSADNVQQYDREYCLVKEYRPVSKYGLVCREPEGATHSCILLAGGGVSRVHEHSAVVVNGSCFVGVGDMLCCLSLPTLDLKWAIKVDTATCFGVYYFPQDDCLLSHGELEIARVSLSGQIVWSVSGKEILSEGFRIVDDHVEVIDFNQEVYRIDIATGQCELVQGLNN